MGGGEQCSQWSLRVRIPDTIGATLFLILGYVVWGEEGLEQFAPFGPLPWAKSELGSLDDAVARSRDETETCGSRLAVGVGLHVNDDGGHKWDVHYAGGRLVNNNAPRPFQLGLFQCHLSLVKGSEFARGSIGQFFCVDFHIVNHNAHCGILQIKIAPSHFAHDGHGGRGAFLPPVQETCLGNLSRKKEISSW